MVESGSTVTTFVVIISLTCSIRNLLRLNETCSTEWDTERDMHREAGISARRLGIISIPHPQASIGTVQTCKTGRFLRSPAVTRAPPATRVRPLQSDLLASYPRLPPIGYDAL